MQCVQCGGWETKAPRDIRDILLRSFPCQAFRRLEAVEGDEVPPQVRQLGWYESGLCHMFRHEWKQARGTFGQLEEERSWSPAFHRYVQSVRAN